MALFLAGDEAQFITGQAMVVDGGVTAGPPVVANPEFGGATALYERNAYVGPSFTVGKV